MNILYSTGCPRCKVIEQKLNEKNIPYKVCTNMDDMITHNIYTVPMLDTPETGLMDFGQIINWLKGESHAN